LKFHIPNNFHNYKNLKYVTNTYLSWHLRIKSLWTNLYVYLWDMAITMTTTLQNLLNSPKIGLVIHAITHYYEDFRIKCFFEVLIFIVYYDC
jgi:hypothetical protein